MIENDRRGKLLQRRGVQAPGQAVPKSPSWEKPGALTWQRRLKSPRVLVKGRAANSCRAHPAGEPPPLRPNIMPALLYFPWFESHMGIGPLHCRCPVPALWPPAGVTHTHPSRGWGWLRRVQGHTAFQDTANPREGSPAHPSWGGSELKDPRR